jgi:hypothetical protein
MYAQTIRNDSAITKALGNNVREHLLEVLHNPPPHTASIVTHYILIKILKKTGGSTEDCRHQVHLLDKGQSCIPQVILESLKEQRLDSSTNESVCVDFILGNSRVSNSGFWFSWIDH